MTSLAKSSKNVNFWVLVPFMVSSLVEMILLAVLLERETLDIIIDRTTF